MSFYNKDMKKIVLGILAHVDAGKTTLSESILFKSGAIRKKGRVDHQDAFLDYDSQERNRGITIFSKQARFSWKDTCFTLIDTPGHVDFSSEMERSLQVLDICILVISGSEGVQSHSETIFKLLQYYQIPTVVYVNKMDISYLSKEKIMNDLHQMSSNIIDFQNENRDELIAMINDELLEKYMNHQLESSDIQKAVSSCELIPCLFGSALKGEHVDELLDLLDTYTQAPIYPDRFGARVFKISHDEKENRLTHLKITGGCLKVKEKINDEKVDQIRIYSGNKYELCDCAKSGEIIVVQGLEKIQAGEGLGYESIPTTPQLVSYMKYTLKLPKDCDIQKMLKNLKMLMEEDPQLHLTYNDELSEIQIQLMGEVQIEILKTMIAERFGVEVEFDQGNVVYLETIEDKQEGIGHFEPLRHYAEVHLLLESLPRGSGLIFDSKCNEDHLSKNWQRLILTHLQEKQHLGVLTAHPITDMKITLMAGKAHQKHTEGGDFREATYRAVRQGLKKAQSILLEPYYQFKLVVPTHLLSKAIYDIESRFGTFTIEDELNQMSIITGKAPVSTMRNYQMEVLNYTSGKGKLMCQLFGYEKCHNSEEIIEKFHYDSEHDGNNPCGSVFCRNGAGFYVPWNEVENYMHLKSILKSESDNYQRVQKSTVDEDELLRIFERTYGPTKTRLAQPRIEKKEEKVIVKTSIKKQCLLVDGYNIIHDWNELKKLAKDNLDVARDRLIDILSNYQGYKNCCLILVFDAYKVPSNTGKMFYNGSIYIVYTKTAQTADSYIESATHELVKEYQVSVATSDALEQLIVSGQGARRISAREFEKEVAYTSASNMKEYESKQSKAGHRKLENLRKYNQEEDE